MVEKVNFSWNNFSIHTSELLSELSNNLKFSDVTLICDDLTQIRAHKFILTACSSVFKRILDNEIHGCLYLRGIPKQIMMPLLQFMYLGETSIQQDTIQELLNVAKELEIKELGTYLNMLKVKDTQIDEIIEETFQDNTTNEDQMNKDNKKKYSCQQCDFQTTFLSNLKLHTQAKHEGVTYKCQECQYEATQPGALKTHVEYRHIGIRYPCKQCSHKATTMGNLKLHVQSKHDRITYSCDLCEYQSKLEGNLRLHYKRKHVVTVVATN